MAYNNNNNNYYKMMVKKKQRFQGLHPANLLNTLFMSTVDKASKMLLSVVSHNYTLDFSSPSFSMTNPNYKWKVQDHLRFMSLLFTWFAMWALRLVIDVLPSSSSLSLLSTLNNNDNNNNNTQLISSTYNHKARNKRPECFIVDDGDGDGDHGSSSSSAVRSLDLVAAASSAASPSSVSAYTGVENLDLISHDGFLMDDGGDDDDYQLQAGLSVEALGRALSQILSLLNELPVTSRKYEFAMAMADRLLDDNIRDGNIELFHVNRAALSSAFGCTVNRLYHVLNNDAMSQADKANNRGGPWTMRVIRKLPLGTYISAYMKGGISAVFPHLQWMWQLQNMRCLMTSDVGGGGGGDDECVSSDQSAEVVGAEKLAQELLWIIHKLRACHAVDEALVQWSLASNLASLTLNANPRVQALFMKISASLLGDIARADFKVHTQVQYRLLVLWLPLFCYASSGLRYPALSCYERIDVERTIERMIASLPAMEQEIVLRNWLQDFAICSSDWPNLRPSYDRWCQSSRQLCIT